MENKPAYTEKWLAMNVRTSHDRVSELIAVLYERNLFQFSEREEGDETLYTLYFHSSAESRGVMEDLITALNEGHFKWSVMEIADEDWAESWKNCYRIERIGRNIVLKPPWESYSPSGDEIVLEIEPRMAFGSGYHPTTMLTLILSEEYLREGMRVLDMGCGSGILAIYALYRRAGHVLCADFDSIAVGESRRNIDDIFSASPEAQKRADVIQSDGFQGVEGFFDLLMVNINTRFLLGNMENICRHTAKDGIFITGAVEPPLEEALMAEAEKNGFALLKREILDNWTGFAFVRKQ